MLSSRTLNELVRLALFTTPEEMCGLMFSKERFHQGLNSAADPTRTFELSHRMYEQASELMGEQPWAIVHSHPGKGAAPSPADCKLMDALQLAKMDLAMIIVGLNPVEIRCFKKMGDNYKLEWCHVPQV